jgi:hypothetical protein
MRSLIPGVTFFLIATIGRLAGAVEPERKVEGKAMILVGSGVRDKEGDKLYNISFFVGEKEARRSFPALVMRAGGKDKARLTRGDHAPAFLVWGHFPKLAVLKFTRAVPAKELRADLQSALDMSVKGADDFLAAVDDARAGDEWLLTSLEDGEVTLTIAGTPRPGPAGPKVARAIWNIWLGEHPLSTDLRRALIEHIDVLGSK